MYRYEVLRTNGACGILVREEQSGDWIAVAVAAPFSGDREAVAELSEKCNVLQLSPSHLIDVISDFVSQMAIDT